MIAHGCTCGVKACNRQCCSFRLILSRLNSLLPLDRRLCPRERVTRSSPVSLSADHFVRRASFNCSDLLDICRIPKCMQVLCTCTHCIGYV